jgi:hypothetical protein
VNEREAEMGDDGGMAMTQVAQVAARSSGRGEPGRYFDADHPLERLVEGRWSRICRALSPYDINLRFNQTSDEADRRSAFRQDYGALLGPGMDLLMPTAGAYMCWPGRNRVVLPTGTDRSLVAYLQATGFLGEVVYHDHVDKLVPAQRAAGRRTYSIDDMGPDGDDVAVNRLRDMVIGNSKETVCQLSAFAAPEIRKDMFEVDDADFDTCHEPGRRVFVKACNTENAGEGVFPVENLDEFRTVLDEARAKVARYDLNRTVVIQPEVVGVNKSFQVFIDPERTDDIAVVALTDQLVGPDGKKYAGSINHDITRERLEVVGPAIVDLVDRLAALCPDAFGFVMCDYFERPDGSVAVYDPGLRPSSNTGAAMVKCWVEEATGRFAGVANSTWFDFDEPGMPYSKVVDLLGEWADPDHILTHRLGVLPRGHNPIQGKSRFLIVTPTQADYEDFRVELMERVGAKTKMLSL